MSFSDISVKKLDFDFYRGDTTRLTFPNISSYDSGQTVKFSVRKTPDSTLVISKDIATSTTEGNDWANFIIAVNLTDGDSQLVQEGVYRYDLQVIRAGIVKTEYFGTFNLIGDITRVGQGVIDTITEANIYSALGSNDLAQGAGLVGVATTIWSSILTLSNRSVQKALEWLLNNKLPIPSPFTANRLIKLGASSPDTIVTDITVTSNNDVTGARFVTGSATPTDPSHLTRKDYADGIPEDFLDSLGGTSGQVLTKDSSGYVFDEVPSSDVEGYLDSLGGSVGDVLSKTSGGYDFDPPGGVEAYLDSLGGSIGDVLTKTSGGYDIETPTQQPLSDGSAASPSLNFASDANTGIYRVGADQIGVSSGGAKVGEFNSNGYMGLDNILIVNEEQTAGTGGGSFTPGAWRDRILNTVKVNRITGASVNTGTGVVTLPAGTYRIESWATAYSIDSHNSQVWNDSDSVELLYGSTEISGSTDATSTKSTILDEFTIAGTKDIKLRHQCQGSRGGNGFGVLSPFTVTKEIYAQLIIRRIA